MNASGGTAQLRVALGQYDTGWHDPAASLQAARRVIARAAAAGAHIVMLPEMCTSGFTMDAEAQTEAIDGPSARELGRLAAEHNIHLLAGLATRECTTDSVSFHNSAVLFGPDGEQHAKYRKQRLFQPSGEDTAYSPGCERVIVDVLGVRAAILICYDLRFAELFLAVAPDVDAVFLIANWPVARRAHWDVLVRSRAIECQCYIAAVNRVGRGGPADYDGGSVIYGPWGELLCASGDTDASVNGSPIAFADIDPGHVAGIRAEYPFLKR